VAQSTASFTNKVVFEQSLQIRLYPGEITPAEYYQMYTASETVDWNTITNLEVVGTELFREKRPNQRNIFSLSNGINQYLPELNASAHFDYRFILTIGESIPIPLKSNGFNPCPADLPLHPAFAIIRSRKLIFCAVFFGTPR